VAEVHVHVATAKPHAHPARSMLRWADRLLLGIVMGVAAFAMERAVLRSNKKAGEARAAAR
jgi:hypothetical protein